jgi:predicted Rdx family selenoprotein
VGGVVRFKCDGIKTAWEREREKMFYEQNKKNSILEFLSPRPFVASRIN